MSFQSAPETVDKLLMGSCAAHSASDWRSVAGRFGRSRIWRAGCATPGGTGFCNVELAKAFAERLMALTDWSHIDRNTANEQLGDQAAAIWNELIAQDVAETFSHHYGRELERLWSKSGAPARRHK